MLFEQTLDVLGSLNTSVHYPIGGKELTDTLRGLLMKYRASVLAIQDEVASRDASTSAIIQNEHQIEKQLLDLQKDLASAIIDKNEVSSNTTNLLCVSVIHREGGYYFDLYVLFSCWLLNKFSSFFVSSSCRPSQTASECSR